MIFLSLISYFNFISFRYGGGTSVLGNRRSHSLFGGGGGRAFGLGVGAGFLGIIYLRMICGELFLLNNVE